MSPHLHPTCRPCWTPRRCQALSHSVPLSITFTLSEMPHCYCLFLLILLYSAQMTLPPCSPSGPLPIPELRGAAGRSPRLPAFSCHRASTLLPELLLKRKSDHFSLRLTVLSSEAPLSPEPKLGAPCRTLSQPFSRCPTPLFMPFALPKMHFPSHSCGFQVQAQVSLPPQSLSSTHPLTLHFQGS